MKFIHRGSPSSVKKKDVRSRSPSVSPQKEKRMPIWEINCPTSTSSYPSEISLNQRKDDRKTTDDDRSYNKFDRELRRNYESQSRKDDECRYSAETRQDSESRYESGTRQVLESRYGNETRQDIRHESGFRQDIQNHYDTSERPRQESQVRYHDANRQEGPSRYGGGIRQDNHSRYDSITRQDNQSYYDSLTRQDNESRYSSRSRQDNQNRYEDHTRYEKQVLDKWNHKSFSDKKAPSLNKGSYREGSKNREGHSGHTSSRENRTDNKDMYNRNKVKLVDY